MRGGQCVDSVDAAGRKGGFDTCRHPRARERGGRELDDSSGRSSDAPSDLSQEAARRREARADSPPLSCEPTGRARPLQLPTTTDPSHLSHLVRHRLDLMPPAQPLQPRQAMTTVVETGLRLVREFLLDPRRFWQLTALLVAGELALGLLIIRFVPCEPLFGWRCAVRRILKGKLPTLTTLLGIRHRDRLPGLLAAGRRLPRRRA